MRSGSSVAFVCEIMADSATAAPLGAIARTCAVDIGQPLVVRLKHALRAEPSITFRVPVALLFEHDRAWCLVGRVACFCPQARVAVVIDATGSAAISSSRGLQRADAA